MPTLSNRPKSWNDDVRWLLARILGLPSGGGSIPVGIAASSVLERVRGSVTGQDANSEVSVLLPSYAKRWYVASIRFYRTSGSASNMTFSIGESSSYVSGSIDERVRIRQRSVTSPIDEVVLASPGLGIPIETDGSNQIYFRAGWDAGADNAGDYDLWFVQAIEAE